MLSISALLDEVVQNYANSLALPGCDAVIDTDTWVVAGTGIGGHSLTSTDLASARDEADAWFLSNGHKRVSVWHSGAPAGTDGDSNQCVVAI